MAQNLTFAGGVRVADADAHEEPVELGFGQRISAMMFGRVLSRDYHEWLG